MAILTSKQVWRRNPEPEGKQLGNRITPTERDHVRAALEYLRGRYVTTDECCAALGITRDSLQKARSRHRLLTYRVACLVARAAGVPVEKILSGAWPGDRCPHCGGTGKASQVVAIAGRPTKR
jgi:hypothetical protein